MGRQEHRHGKYGGANDAGLPVVSRLRYAEITSQQQERVRQAVRESLSRRPVLDDSLALPEPPHAQRVINERASLWQEVQRLRRRILGDESSSGNGHDAVLFGKDDAHAHAVRILSTAQLTADRYVADAQAYSGRLTEEARNRRDEILTQTQQHADMLLEEARARAREAAVEAMNRETLPPQNDHERRAVEGEVAYLRTFSEVYRQHLKIYTESIQRMLDDWDRKERTTMLPPGPAVGLEAPNLNG